MKIVHAADLHIDSPLRGLERYEGAPVERIRGATRRATENLVDLCLGEDASLLILAGDLFDGDWRDYATGLFFARQMSRLRHADIPVVTLRGNHDAASQVQKHLSLPDNVHELSTRKAQTIELEPLGVALHGQGFARRSVTNDLAAKYPRPIAGMLNIGVLHTCLTGREGHEPYAPCSLQTLIDKGYDYWALGHVHEREVVHRDPWVVFPGNLQGRHARETGPKGAMVITVQDGKVATVEPRFVDVVRWVRCIVDASEADNPHDIVESFREQIHVEVANAEGRTLAVRVRVEGASRAHAALHDAAARWHNEMRAVANDIAGEGVWIERVKLATKPAVEAVDLTERDDAVGQVARALGDLAADESALAAMVDDLAELRRKLPPELTSGSGDALRVDTPGALGVLTDDVARVLLPRLLAGASGSESRAEDETP